MTINTYIALELSIYPEYKFVSLNKIVSTFLQKCSNTEYCFSILYYKNDLLMTLNLVVFEISFPKIKCKG